ANWRSGVADEDFIKRVIGTPGDHLVCCDDQQRITVNGYPLNENYIYTSDDGVQDLPSEQPFDVVVPKGRYWMMGDHRSHSSDSRERYIREGDVTAATIPEDAIVGRAFVIFWPVGRASWLSVPKTFEGIPEPART